MDYEVRRFVRNAYIAGFSESEIVEKLVSEGWSAKDAERAAGEYTYTKDVTGRRFVPPCPRPQPSYAKDAFFALVTFFTMFAVAYYVGSLGWILGEMYLRTHTAQWEPQYVHRDLMFTIPGLVVFVPLWIGLTLQWNKASKVDAAKMFSPVRRWLTYATMVITFIIMVIDLVLILGELLLREDQWQADSVDKLTVFAIAGFFFLFYKAVLKRTDTGR